MLADLVLCLERGLSNEAVHLLEAIVLVMMSMSMITSDSEAEPVFPKMYCYKIQIWVL